MRRYLIGILLAAVLLRSGTGTELPDRYYRLLDAGIAHVEKQLAAEPQADLRQLEARGDGWRLFPHNVLVAAVLYAKNDPANKRYRDPKMLALALRIGDMLASESERGSFQARLNSDRDTYMWLEAYRVLSDKLGPARQQLWRRELEKNIEELVRDSAERADFPGYQSPFIGTSPNHLSLWASTVYLAGRVFGKPDWEKVGAKVMHRLAEEEQSPDGFWGEHDRSLPTPGYDYTTYTGVALYYEHSHDPAALRALRRGLDFKKYFTYPNGWPADVLDDRNRYTSVSGWNLPGFETWTEENPAPAGNDESAPKGQFGFSNFPDGRRYAEFLTSFYREGEAGYEDLGRLAQDALYYHPGPGAPIPQDSERYVRRLSIPAGIRKAGPWVVCLSGLIGTQAITNQYYLDRQAHLSIFHQKTGLIITGAGSKRQPELATFYEKLGDQIIHIPMTSRLRLADTADRLSLSYNTFFSDLYVSPPAAGNLPFRFVVTGRGKPADEARLTLQLYLKAGEVLETGAGKKITLARDRIELSPEDLGGWICHHGWKLKVDAAARLVWPVYPFHPYTNKPETGLAHAVGALSVPLQLKSVPGRYVRPGEQKIRFVLQVEENESGNAGGHIGPARKSRR